MCTCILKTLVDQFLKQHNTIPTDLCARTEGQSTRLDVFLNPNNESMADTLEVPSSYNPTAVGEVEFRNKNNGKTTEYHFHSC